MINSTTRVKRATAGALAALVLAGSAVSCSNSDEGADADSKSSDLEITIVSAPLADPFFGAMKAGAEAAAEDLGVEVQWTSPKDFSNLGPDMAQVGEAAAEAKPDGVVMSYFVPDAQKPGLDKIKEAGIPVTFMNAGFDYEALGGLNFVGEDPTVVGDAAGQRFIDADVDKVMCFNHVPGIEAVQQRCDALKTTLEDAGVGLVQVDLPLTDSTNPNALDTAISGALRNDPDIDAIFTLGSTPAEAAAAAVEKAGRDILLGTTDLSTNVINLIKDGDIAFASDQQPYLTGYYSVQILVQYLQYGVHPIGRVLTAPNWITPENAADVLAVNEANKGIRGAA